MHGCFHRGDSSPWLERSCDRGCAVPRGSRRNQVVRRSLDELSPRNSSRDLTGSTTPRWGQSPCLEAVAQQAQYVIMTGMPGTPDPASAAVDIAELAALLRERRAKDGKSLRDVSAETGVPLATLSRVESGRLPDLVTFRNIVAWLGISPDRFFPTPRLRNETTPDTIAQVLRSDSTLSESAREQLTSTFSQMYTMLTAKEQAVQVHLRSHRLFTPAAGDLLASILHSMLRTLDEEKDA